MMSECTDCRGSGFCQECHGGGGDENGECDACGGEGCCHHCSGSGQEDE